MAHRAHWRQELDDAAYADQLARSAEENDLLAQPKRAPVPQSQPAQIDLAALVTAVLDGAVGDQPMTQLSTMNGACDAVMAVVVAKIGRPLRDGERAKLYIEVGTQFNQRRAQAQRDLVETREALWSPLRVFQ